MLCPNVLWPWLIFSFGMPLIWAAPMIYLGMITLLKVDIFVMLTLGSLLFLDDFYHCRHQTRLTWDFSTCSFGCSYPMICSSFITWDGQKMFLPTIIPLYFLARFYSQHF